MNIMSSRKILRYVQHIGYIMVNYNNFNPCQKDMALWIKASNASLYLDKNCLVVWHNKNLYQL